jgi:hypothetical protein
MRPFPRPTQSLELDPFSVEGRPPAAAASTAGAGEGASAESLRPVKASIHTKLLAVVVPTILLVNLAITATLAVIQFVGQLQELHEKEVSLLATEVRVLSPELSHVHSAVLTTQLAQLVTHSDIVSAALYDASGSEMARAGDPAASTNAEPLSTPVNYRDATGADQTGRLVILHTADRVKDRLWRQTMTSVAGRVQC